MREKNRNSIENIKKLPQFTTMNVIDGQAGLVNYSSLIFYSLTIDNILNIIVLLILAAVSIATLTGENGILTKAKEAKTQNTKSQAEEEAKLAVASLIAEETTTQMTQEEKRQFLNNELKQYDSSSTVENDGTGFSANHRGYEVEIDDKYQVSVKEPFNAEEWDKTAAPEDVFIWQSEDKNDEGYGVVIGYTANADNYTTLRFPSRCTKIEFSTSLNYDGIDTATSRAYTNNILKVEIPSTVRTIGDYAFGEKVNVSFEKLKEVTIEEGVTSIGSNAFQCCYNLTSITIPNSITSIGDCAFYICSKLTSVTIPSSATSIGKSAFFGCGELTSATIQNGVINIGDAAFAYCTSLTSVTIPNSVRSIGSLAFSNVPHIYYNGAATGSPWGALAIN